ncbi:hypothetical protein [Halorubrum sp. N11]|uniref:hypothetical protein n=1 Tax=Halorubrum sp. N11 TaxID=3402276 RepID=UPI003EBB8C51
MRVVTTREVGTDVVMLGFGLLLVAVAVGQLLGRVYGGAIVAGTGAILSFSFAVLLN